MIDKKEAAHQIQVLIEAKEALKQQNSIALKALSNKTIHTSCSHQNTGSITISVVLYALSKLIERHDPKRIKSWPTFVKKTCSLFDLTKSALEKGNEKAYEAYLLKARQSLESVSPSLKNYIKETVKKACINRGSRIYEHGISLERASQILGVSQWELASYAGQRGSHDSPHNKTTTTKSRAQLALQFFK
tara:strand:+ start:478 stop:1047 length:570 start_codon:yes stop_codon:yes gene_type:complete